MHFIRDLSWLIAFTGLFSLTMLGWYFILFLCMDKGGNKDEQE